MERLVEQLVAWHNKHPLALRIDQGDVHTLGIVALPFMRGTPPADAMEPMLTDEVSEEEALARAADAAAGVRGAASIPAPFEAPPSPPRPWWRAFDPRELFSSPTRALLSDLPWPVFSERFIPGLRPAQVAHFALAHGYTSPPGEEDWPQRIVAIDEALVAKAQGSQGAWPMELYLASAAVDAGTSRTRVLIGQGAGSELLMLGRRCLDKRRVAAAALAGLALLAVPLWMVWPHHQPADAVGAAAVAASAPSAPASAMVAAPASAPASSPAAVPAPASDAASTAHAAAEPAKPDTPPVVASPEPRASTTAAPLAATSVSAAPTPAQPPQAPAASAPAPNAAGLRAADLPNELAPAGSIPSIRPNMVSTPRTRKAAEAAAAAAEAAEAAKASEASAKQAKAAKDSAGPPPAKGADKSPSGTPPPEPTKGADRPSGKPTDPTANSLADKAAHKPISPSTPEPKPLPPKTAERAPAAEAPSASAKSAASQLGRPGQTVVALVGPSLQRKADAEAMLERMRGMVAQTVGDPSRLQAQVFQTPDGWRAAIWPFATREEAQLINATMIARGMKTRAVDF